MPQLMDPLQVGRCALRHRVVMAPMTRLRANDDHVPGKMMFEYFTQRASVPGTLLITDASFISANSRGRDENAPGIYTDAQIQAWKRITDGVHARGSYIFIQLWHVGRAARQHVLDKIGLEMLSSSNIPISDKHKKPRSMTTKEIWECIASFAQAAKNAVSAGFDGVEIHGANGYLVDQFIQDTCNVRRDEWGGSVENRSRFCVEVVKAVCEAIGPDRTAVRLSPFSTFQGMRMKDPIPQFTDLISRLRELCPAYLHLIEPQVAGNVDKGVQAGESLDFAIKIWSKANPIILAGGYSLEKVIRALETTCSDEPVGFAFGRHFISNPDLPFRLENNLPLAQHRIDGFYTAKSPEGYIDYAFSEPWRVRGAL